MNEAIGRLDRAAARALGQGNLTEALRLSLELERRDPNEPNWSRRSAYVLNRLGRRAEEIAALERAAERCAAKDDWVRALAQCRAILALDPSHPGARAQVRRWADGRGAGSLPRASTAVPPSAVASGSASGPPSGRGSGPARDPRRPVRLPPPGMQTSLDRVPWRQAVGRSTQIRGDAERGVHQIALDEATGTLDLGLEAGEPDAPPDVQAAVDSVERELRQLKRTERALQDTPLFRALEADALEILVDRVRSVRHAADEYVLRQGEPGVELFVIVDGEVGVIDDGPPQRPLARLGPGDFFGEGALVTDQPRSASVAALTELELIVIDRDTLWAVLDRQPGLWPSLLALFRDRAVDRILMQSPLFLALSGRDRSTIRPFFRLIEVDPGADALVQDQMAEALSFVVAGELEVHRDGRPMTRLRPGNLFGETSLLCREPSAVGVRAVERCYLVEFPGPAFRRIVDHRPRALSFISQVVEQRRRALAALQRREDAARVREAL